MNQSPQKSIESHRETLEHCFKEHEIPYKFKFDKDPTTNGYCYIVGTPFGLGIFSDNNSENELKMFILKNSAVNYANDEDLTDEQFSEYKSCVEIPSIQDFVYILSNPMQQELK